MIVSSTGNLLLRATGLSNTWILEISYDKLYKLPGQPTDPETGRPIPASAIVRLVCYLPVASSRTCSSVSDARVLASAAPVPTTNKTLRLLIMVVSLATSTDCAGRLGADVTKVRDAFLAPGGYADYFKNCSYGSMVLDRQALKVVPIELPCTRDINGCNANSVALAARAGLPADVPDYMFSHFLYVMPNGTGPVCGWSGIADLPGSQSWFTADDWGIGGKGTVMQQIIHNFGLYSAWKNGVEDGDYSTAMGFGDSCPSAPELWRLGWATPLAQLNSSSFPSGVFQDFVLPATYLGPTGVMIKIQPDWLGAAYTKNLYLALRINGSGDMDLLDEFNRKLNMHELDKAIDNDYYAAGDPTVSIIGVLNPTSSVTLFNYRLYIITEGLVNGGTSIAVRVCRFEGGPNECANTDRKPSLADAAWGGSGAVRHVRTSAGGRAGGSGGGGGE
ncbi:hypothetical protein PLESTF_001890000 [Pleodorina starrii]|nr:hypothetical protein PLESTF_001890000 [Pleodorina starrii]